MHSDDGSELEASFTSEYVNVSTSSIAQQNLMTGTATSDWIFQASPARMPNTGSATTTYRKHQPSPIRSTTTSTSTPVKSMKTPRSTTESPWR